MTASSFSNLFSSDTLAAAIQSTCTTNGQSVPCDQMIGFINGLLGFGLSVLLIVLLLSIASFAFWLVMLIHAASKPIEKRVLWILVQVFFGVAGSIVYYFAVKREFDRKTREAQAAPPPAPS
jgi:hypothetical protein